MSLGLAIASVASLPTDQHASFLVTFWLGLSAICFLATGMFLPVSMAESAKRYRLWEDDGGTCWLQVLHGRKARPAVPLSAITSIDQRYSGTRNQGTSATLRMLNAPDIRLPGEHCDELVRLIRQRHPNIPLDRYREAEGLTG